MEKKALFHEAFSARLRHARESAGVTQQEAADAVYLEIKSYRRYERARSQPSLVTLTRLCDLFGVSADWLLGRVDA